jgi:hypothetical protein
MHGSIYSLSTKVSVGLLAITFLAGCPAPNPTATCIMAIDNEIRDLENEREIVREDLARGFTFVSEEEEFVGNFTCIQQDSRSAVLNGTINVFQFGVSPIPFGNRTPIDACRSKPFISSIVQSALIEAGRVKFNNCNVERLSCNGDGAATQFCTFSGVLSVRREESIDTVKLTETLKFLDTEIPILQSSAEERKMQCSSSL